VEPPQDISTLVWRPRMPSVPPPGVSIMDNTPIPFNPMLPVSHMSMSSPALVGSTPVQTLTRAPQVDNMQLCTSSGGGTPSSVAQRDLPNVLPIPGREIQQFTAQVQGNWDILFDFMKRQEKTVNDLTQEIKVTSSHHKSQFADLVAKVEDNKSQVFTLLTTTKQKEESETDKLTKAVKQMITDELQKVESTLVSEMRFMVDQLQAEVQQDIKAIQDTFQTNHDHTTSELQQCVTQIDNVSTCVKELRNEMEKGFQGLKKQMEEQQKLPSPVLSTPITSTLPSEPSTSVTPLPSSVVKSEHIKLTFPTFGRPSDDADPLLYLTKCQDFLALHPLTDADILATFRTVLHGTARDWWEVRRSSISTWSEFEAAFLSAFLSEDYEDELAERVRTKIQGEKETIRDFAFSYRALCKRWKADLTEGEIVRMILKNIKPYLASQLRSRVNTVEELVKLGHQLEKDYEQQLRYEGRMGPKHPTTSQRPSSNRPAEKIPVQCWRCSGQHPPGKCPHYVSPQSSGHQFTSSKHPYSSSQTRGQSSNNSVAATRMQKPPSTIQKASISTSSNAPMTIPQQLVVPISIATWTGKAIVETGASYTLIHEGLMKQLASPDQLQIWSHGPLCVANGEAETPLGWINTTIQLHDQAFAIPAAVLSSKALAYAVVLGLDFVFFSGMQINVTDQKYSFKFSPAKEYPFQPGNASVPIVNPQQENLQQEKTKNLSLLSSIPPPSPQLLIQQPDNVDERMLIRNAVDEAHLPPDGKQQLLSILESNPRVCTLRTGRTDVLQHHIYTTCQIPIKQKPYRLSPLKQLAMEEQLEEMLKQGIVEPSHSGWASPVVLVPKKDGKLRFCVDYRKINSVTESDAYPLPNITEILESLSGAAIFSTIDLNSGYWQ
ncbi:hypothetical protein M9458_036089, partial [Cirrhinus mrigala]